MGYGHKAVKDLPPDSIKPLLRFIFFHIPHFPTDSFEITQVSHPYVIDNPL